jgi:hypothetical protein
MNKGESILIRIWPWLSLLVAGTFFTLVFPPITDIQEWIFKGYEIVIFPVWFISGAIFGSMIYAIWERWPRSLGKFVRRLILVLFGYIGIALAIALATGTGEGIERIGGSEPVQIWGIIMWAFLGMAPSLFGVLAIMKGVKWARGASVLAFISLSAITMIFSQASRAEITSQDPFLSVGFIWAILLFVEGLNWKRRYWDEGGEVNMSLWRRQAAFTMIFLGAGSAIAIIPFLFTEDLTSYYEGEAIIGKALFGAFLLVPMAIGAIIKGVTDRRVKD